MGESNDYQYHEIRGKYHSRERWHFEFISSQPRIHHLNIWNLVCTDLQIGFLFQTGKRCFFYQFKCRIIVDGDDSSLAAVVKRTECLYQQIFCSSSLDLIGC